jgi:hypothetical protein
MRRVARQDNGSVNMAIIESALAQMPAGRRGNSLADVLDLILDKGLVIDAFVRVSVIGIEVLTVDARIVIASVDTYLRFAEAVNRLDLTQTKESTTYQDLVQGGSKKLSEGGTEGVIEGVKEEMPGRKKKEEQEPSTASDGSTGSGRRSGNGSRSSAGDDDGDEDDDDDGGDGKGPIGRLRDRAKYSS